MNDVLETAKQSFLTPLMNAPLIVAVGIGLLALGWLLKVIPQFPNQWIPAVVVIVGGVIGYFVVPMQGPADWAFRVANPEVADVIRRVAVGLAIGVAAFLVEKYAVKKIENWIKSKLGNGNGTPTSTP